MKKEDGLTKDQIKLRSMTSNFYKKNCTLQNGSTEDMDGVLSTLPTKVTPPMNRKLLDPYKEGEVKEALFHMFPMKALGPDGFPAHFFQRYWELCGKEVTVMVLKLLRGEEEPTGINETLIVLIPKMSSPRRSVNFVL